jgi:hypothetical protein
MPEKIIIQGKEACLNGDGNENHSLAIPKFAIEVSTATLHGLTHEPLPDNIKWFAECGPLDVRIFQLTPERRWIKWLADNSPAPYGPEALYKEYSLAMPYVVLKVAFLNGQVTPRTEVFFRNDPLSYYEGEGGELFFPSLLNCSVDSYGCKCWFCTQNYSPPKKGTSLQNTVNEIANHLFGGGFNASSEAHEGLSAFGLCVKEKVDDRITDIHRWAEASQQDPRFVLSVKWKTTGLTVRDLIEREMKFHKIAPAPQTVQAVGNLMLRKTKPK